LGYRPNNRPKFILRRRQARGRSICPARIQLLLKIAPSGWNLQRMRALNRN